MVASKSWWRSLAQGFFCGRGWEKSQLTLTRCRTRVAPFLPRGRRGNTLPTVLCLSEKTLGHSGPGKCTVSMVLRGGWNVTDQRRWVQRLGHHRFVTSLVFISFRFGHVVTAAPAFYLF
jgi:hypothetical protein